MKKIAQLIKLLEKKSSPEIVVKYIYLNIFELIKLSVSFQKSNNCFSLHNRLSEIYLEYYSTVICNYEEEWVKTIFPSYIYGYKNFYQGVAGRLEFFSINIASMIDVLESSDITKDLTCRILLNTPDTYYWYGNPDNWSYCYEIKLNESNQIEIRKRQILVLEDEYKVYEAMLDGKEEYTNIMEILLLSNANPSIMDVEDKPFPYPTRRYHACKNSFLKHNLDESITKMMSNYKLNVSKKTGYSPQIQSMWEERNKQEAENKWQKKDKLLGEYTLNYKVLKEEEILELEKKFFDESKKKKKRIKG